MMGLVFLFGFRRPAAALLPLAKLGVCLVLVFGLMGWLGVPVYLTTAVLPVILIAVGMTGEVHILRRFSALFSQRPEADRAELARAALEEVEQPILQASAIAAIGFLSFSVTTLAPVRAFGLFAAAGVGLCLLWSLSATPAILALLPPHLLARRGMDARDERENLFGRLAGLAAHRRTILILLAAISLLALDGVRRLQVQDSWVDGFAPGSAFAREMRRFDEQFHGAHTLLVTVAAEPLRLTGEVAGASVGDRRLLLPLRAAGGIPPATFEGGFLDLESRETVPAATPTPAPRQWSSWVESSTAEGGHLVLSWPLRGGSPKFQLQPEPGGRVGYELHLEPLSVPAQLRRIRDLERFLERLPGVGGVLGPAQFLETASFMMQPDEPGSRRLPETPADARILWNNSEIVRGSERLHRLVDAERSQGLVTVFLKHSNYADTRRLMDQVREHERRDLAPAGLRLGFAGDVAVSQALIRAVVTTQVGSLAFSLLGIFALTAWLLRSPRQGLYCALPVTLAVLLDFAVMGWLGIPLGVATSMFASMTLGVGVDSTLHLLERYDRLRSLSGALSSAGPPILIDSLSTSLGFAVLLLSRVPANNRLGGLLALSLLAGLAATLLIVPALLARPRRRQGVY
jgi:predicted RND superfamily exporter protein